MTIALLSLGLTIGFLVIILLFKIASKIRFTLPLLYFLVISFSTMFSDWVTRHERGVWIGFFILISLSIASWIVTFIRFLLDHRQMRFEEEDALWQIQKARERDISLDSISFSSDGSLLDPLTKKPIVW